MSLFFFFQAEDGIRDTSVTGVQTCALPILGPLSCGDTASGSQLPFVRELRRLLRVGLFAVLDEDLVDLREQPVHELVLGERADDLSLPEDQIGRASCRERVWVSMVAVGLRE